MIHKQFRQGVVAIFVNKESLVLTCQRSDNQAWQFPQGGIDQNEDELSALFREVKEEIACENFIVLKKMETKLKYFFPSNLQANISKNFCGQEQRWFLCQLNNDEQPNFEQAESDEFIDFKWSHPKDVLSGIVSWKRDVYEQAFTYFNLL